MPEQSFRGRHEIDADMSFFADVGICTAACGINLPISSRFKVRRGGGEAACGTCEKRRSSERG